MARLDQHIEKFSEQTVEHLRLGTRKQWENETWQLIAATPGFNTFNHDLGEIPWVVDVLSADNNTGKFAVDANADVTITKTDSTIKIENTTATDLYYKVRAM